jgi:hypothetical protein
MRIQCLIAALLLAGCGGSAPTWEADALPIYDAPPDVLGFQGWSGPEQHEDTKAWAASLGEFGLINDRSEKVWQDNVRANVRNWEDVATANGGEFPKNIAQQIGDCTSWGAKHAVETLIGKQTARGPPGRFFEASSMFMYGAARVWIGKRIYGPGDGCSGAALARSVNEIGVVAANAPGVPRYNGTIARRWGDDGPPESLREVAARHKVKTVAALTTVDQVRDAVCNGYGVTIASKWGTTNQSMRVLDGRVVAKRNGSWAHQMCIIGYDGSAASGRQYFYVLNSWGPDAHPAPLNGEPPGGFWIQPDDLKFILSMNDTWAFSVLDGFPARLDFGPLRPRRPLQPVPDKAFRRAAPKVAANIQRNDKWNAYLAL